MTPAQPTDTPPSVAAAFPRHDNVGYVRAGQILPEIVQGPGWSRSVRGEAGEKGWFVSASSFFGATPPPPSPCVCFSSFHKLFFFFVVVRGAVLLSLSPRRSVCVYGGKSGLEPRGSSDVKCHVDAVSPRAAARARHSELSFFFSPAGCVIAVARALAWGLSSAFVV